EALGLEPVGAYPLVHQVLDDGGGPSVAQPLVVVRSADVVGVTIDAQSDPGALSEKLDHLVEQSERDGKNGRVVVRELDRFEQLDVAAGHDDALSLLFGAAVLVGVFALDARDFRTSVVDVQNSVLVRVVFGTAILVLHAVHVLGDGGTLVVFVENTVVILVQVGAA